MAISTMLLAVLSAGPASAHSVPQVQTTKYLAPETLASILIRAAQGGRVMLAGDIVSYIIQFTPIENGATVGAGGYVTEYLPEGLVVVGAEIVTPDGAGGFQAVPPKLPGPIKNGWGRDEQSWGPPFDADGYADRAAGATNPCSGYGDDCNGTLAMVYADTGIFYSTDVRTKVFTDLAGETRVLQGTNGYNVNSRGQNAINAFLNQEQATTHNLWDADQTNAFGSSSIPSAPASDVVPLAQDGSTPFNAGSAVAGPESGYKLDNSGAVGPWQRIKYSGSRIGNTDEGPAVSKIGSENGVSQESAIVGGATTLGWELSPENPLPAAANAVRFAVGALTVGELRYVKVSVRLTEDAPDTGIVNNSEVFGGDSASAAEKDGKDAAWKYHVPSVASNNSNLYVLKQVVAVNDLPYYGTLIPSGSKVTYRISYFNTGNNTQTKLILKDILPSQMDGTIIDVRHVSGVNVLPYANDSNPGDDPQASDTISFTEIPFLHTGGGGILEMDIRLSADDGSLILNRATFESDQLVEGVVTNAPSIIGQRAFLRIQKQISPAAAQPGDTVEYTITLTNTGFATATALTLRDWLPTGDISGSAAGDRFGYVAGSSVVTGLTNASPTAAAPASTGAFTGENREEIVWDFGGGTLDAGASATITFSVTIGATVAKTIAPYRNTATIFYNDDVADTFVTASEAAPVLIGNSVGGVVFEDTGYNGGPGRTLMAAATSAAPIPGVRIEIYDPAGAYVTATNTDATGNYLIGGLDDVTYTVRVPSTTVGDFDSAPAAGLYGPDVATPVQVFESDGVTDNANQVGGNDPGRVDADPNLSSPLATLDTATTVAQTTFTVSLNAEQRTGADVGFGFNLVVNTLPAGQGSLSAFLTNARRIVGTNASVFMIPVGSDPLGRLEDPNVVDGVAVITQTSPLPPIDDAGTSVDATPQTVHVGDTNPAELGSDSAIAGPEVSLVDGGDLPTGLFVDAADSVIRGLAVAGFGTAPDGDTSANILVSANGSGLTVDNVVIGGSAVDFTLPIGGNGGDGIRVLGATGGSITGSLIGNSSGAGINLTSGSDGWNVGSSEIIGNGQGVGSAGISVVASTGFSVTTSHIADNRGAGIAIDAGSPNATVSGSTITANGVGLGGSTAGVWLVGDNASVTSNTITGNYGAGVAVSVGAEANTIRFNT
ncbi:MAG: putative repeat protein (TIGR01451 family), partial [Myxococcota bacterium]